MDSPHRKDILTGTKSGLMKNMSGLFDRVPFFKRKADAHLKEVLSGASAAFAVRVSGAGLAFLLNLMLARVLGAEQLGNYLLAVTVCTIAAVFGRFGLDNVLVRFTASGAAAGDWPSVKGLYHKGLWIGIAASAVSSAVMFAYAPVIAEHVFSKKELTWPIRAIALAVIPVTVAFLFTSLLGGLKRIRDSQLVQGIGMPGFTLLAFFIAGRHWGLDGAVWSYVVGAATASVTGYALFTLATPYLNAVRPDFDTGLIIRTSIPLLLVDSMHFINGWITTVMLGVYRTSGEVGIFNMALRTAMLTSLALIAVNAIASPKFSAFHSRGEISELSRIGVSSSRLILIVSSPLLLIFVLAPGIVLSIFGENFRAGSTALVLLAAGQFINAITGSVGQMLAMTGHEVVLRNIIMATAALNVVLSVALIPAWGINGAAAASSASAVCGTVLASIFVYRYLKIKIHAFARI